jgi:hypothetical protein
MGASRAELDPDQDAYSQQYGQGGQEVHSEAEHGQGHDGDEDEGDDREHGDRSPFDVAAVVLMSQGCCRRAARVDRDQPGFGPDMHLADIRVNPGPMGFQNPPPR